MPAGMQTRRGLERDELAGLRRLPRRSAYVLVNELGDPFKREGIARMIQRAGLAASIPFPIHVHMLRHACGYAPANKGMDTRRLQHFTCLTLGALGLWWRNRHFNSNFLAQ